MMTSVVSNQSRGARDKTLPTTTTTQTTQPQKQIQATAEQIRLAQMIYDKNDADFEDKVKQLIEVSGKTQDECMVALHDCNEDVNRAINFLLESTSDTTSWETVGKKRNLGKEGGSSEIKEISDKKGGDRETSRGRGGSSRRGRGISRGREGRLEENGFEVTPGERGGDRGRRGRGRGAGGRGRGRAAAGNRVPSQGMGTFNPTDFTANSGNRQEAWNGEGKDPAEGTGTWGGPTEDWTSEDWNEDQTISPLDMEVKAQTENGLLATHSHESSLPPLRDGASPGVKLPGIELQGTEAPQRQIKAQKRRVPPPSKIPSSAVEMPGSADVPGLNVQFGALDFGSETGSGMADMAQTETGRDQASRVESSGPRSLPPHMGFPQNKDLPSSAPLTVKLLQTWLRESPLSLPTSTSWALVGCCLLTRRSMATRTCKCCSLGFPWTIMAYLSLARQLLCLEEMVLETTHTPVSRQSLAGMTPRPQLLQPACLQRVCSHSPSRRHSQERRHRDRTRPSRHRIRPSLIPHCPLAMDIPVCRIMLVCQESPRLFQYGPTVFVPPACAKQPTMGLANPSSQYHQQHQPSYGQHAYGTAFDDLSQTHGEYSKGGYGGSAQSQSKSAASGPGKGLSGSGSSGGVPDLGGSIYSKTQSFDKQGFHTGTPPPFSLPSALGGTGPLNPGGAPGYAPAPFLHIMPPHQQPHSQLLHHHLTQDGQ
ncbi:unnamed protein product, partial [Tetraodon nigroviridis]